jgi:cytoplasmic iron level regulating protein YaaA (DUF328/UPF0246 family)
MLLVISPAKSLELEKPFPSNLASMPVFEKEPYTLIKTLKKLKKKDIERIFGLSPKLAELNYTRFQEFENEQTIQRPAIFTFDGDVYTGLDAFSLDKNQIEFAQNQVRILSGLYGLLKPLDLIKPYRLEMGTKLAFGKSSNLYSFWKEKVSKEVNKTLEEHNHQALINLASIEYFSAIDSKKIKKPIIQCEFLEKKDADYKNISFFSKKARGLMTRFVIDMKIENPEHLQAFDYENYQFNSQLSNTSKYVFTRG